MHLEGPRSGAIKYRRLKHKHSDEEESQLSTGLRQKYKYECIQWYVNKVIKVIVNSNNKLWQLKLQEITAERPGTSRSFACSSNAPDCAEKTYSGVCILCHSF